MEQESSIKSPEKIEENETEKQLEDNTGGIDVWEGEGGAVSVEDGAEEEEMEKGVDREKESDEFPMSGSTKEEITLSSEIEATLSRPWLDILLENRSELPEKLRRSCSHIEKGKILDAGQGSSFNKKLNVWWKVKFGISFEEWKKLSEARGFRQYKLNRAIIYRADPARARKEATDSLRAGESMTRAPIMERSSKYRRINKSKTSKPDGILKGLPPTIKTVGRSTTPDVFALKQLQYDRERERYKVLKNQRMNQLRLALKDLDAGEPIMEFKRKDRRLIFHNSESDQYYLEEKGRKIPINIGDILSDYAWSIKYVPDGEMAKSAYRTLAKRILINEARRDVETLFNAELYKSGQADKTTITFTVTEAEQSLLKESSTNSLRGALAERMVVEFLSRNSTRGELGYIVERANVLEDSRLKYDFKIKTSVRIRGIKMGIKRVGIQLKSKVIKYFSLVNTTIYKYPADSTYFHLHELQKMVVAGEEFIPCFKKWLSEGKPSGGPEQFLSRELKISILKAVTKNLVKISDEEIKKLFPSENTEIVTTDP